MLNNLSSPPRRVVWTYLECFLLLPPSCLISALHLPFFFSLSTWYILIGLKCLTHCWRMEVSLSWWYATSASRFPCICFLEQKGTLCVGRPTARVSAQCSELHVSGAPEPFISDCQHKLTCLDKDRHKGRREPWPDMGQGGSGNKMWFVALSQVGYHQAGC